MKVIICSSMCLILMLHWVLCKENSVLWARLDTGYTYGTSTAVEGQLSVAQCLTKCLEIKGCVSVNVQRERLQCEVSVQHPLDKRLTPSQRPGWTVFYKKVRRNCHEIMKSGDTTTGFKTIYPDEMNPVEVLCVMDEDGGGWTVFQKRELASDFYKGWNEYQSGFGDKINFWLGLETIHLLTVQGNVELRVDMVRKDNSRAAAKYSEFWVGNESKKYQLSVGGYGFDPTFTDPGDSFIRRQNGMAFSTFDRDNDIKDYNCAERFKGAWWYSACHYSNLNGEYGNAAYGEGINWESWTTFYQSLNYTRMMIRPKSP